MTWAQASSPLHVVECRNEAIHRALRTELERDQKAAPTRCTVDQDEVMERPGISNDDGAFRLFAKASKRGKIGSKFFVLPASVRLGIL